MAALCAPASCLLAARHSRASAGRQLRAPKPRAEVCRSCTRTSASLKALLFDCDGVILESEELHRRAYNAVFEHYAVTVGGAQTVWTEAYYDMLSNTVGGGKPKMRWHFSKVGWPESSSVLPGPCSSDADKELLIDTLQAWKTEHYEALIKSGQVEARPGVLRLMDEARAAGLAVAVCSAATKSAAVTTVSSLLGKQRWEALDCFLAGNDVAKLKPDPLIYNTAAQKLGLLPSECLVVEDSTVGLRAATAAGMACLITYTRTGASEPFAEALCVVSELDKGGVTLKSLQAAISKGERTDDRMVSL